MKPKVVRKARTRESFIRSEASKNPKHWSPEYRQWVAKQMLKEQNRDSDS